ncbi:MAG: maleylpyruvate isomerase family mycothiol-dependent enzyme [Micropruina sp.]|uniref:maleylpyruvate isomerase family mycothiol-dependent enzyme n=1 Tax=Micropruina sp. TaxID=2737536 RepID=UPI0039E6460C
MTEQTFTAPLETLRKRIHEATQRLLGDTIGISDDDWNRPSRLPGWSRANVATHLSANADALAELIDEAIAGRTAALYPDEEARAEGIERGSSMTGLELQICLDTSAGRLERAMDAVEDWSAPVELLGRQLTLAQVPMARLAEIVAHHLDLDCGFEVGRLDSVSARWLLQWASFRHADDADLPALRLESTSGLTADLGPDGEPRTVTGSDAALWAWLIGRVADDELEGADDLMPALRA